MQDAVDFSWLRRCRAWVAVPIADEAIDGSWFCGDGKGRAEVPGEENCVEITKLGNSFPSLGRPLPSSLSSVMSCLWCVPGLARGSLWLVVLSRDNQAGGESGTKQEDQGPHLGT